MNKQFYHQGDVPFFPHKGEITGEMVKHDGKLTLAWGEATGHHHTIHVPNVDDMDAVRTADGGWLLTLRAPGNVFTETAYYAIYTDLVPRSDKVYMSGVEKSATVAEAMAWKFSNDDYTLSPKEWLRLVPGLHMN